MTGLLNRRAFLRSLERIPAFQTGIRNKKHRPDAEIPVVCCLDLNDFKPVNDTYGHAAGDKVLTECAARIRSALRPGEFAARLGGDEFAMLMFLPQTAENGERELPDRLRRLCALLEEEYSVDNGKVGVSASLGTAFLNENAVALAREGKSLGEILMEQADRAMYAEKAKRKTCPRERRI